nr:hypothetical protein [Nostoc sp. ChiSLP01]
MSDLKTTSVVGALALLIRVNLSSNVYPTCVLPYPLPLPDALGRGGFGFRQNRGGVERIFMETY